jgi:DNA-binding NarL/FixJ family response regulator
MDTMNIRNILSEREYEIMEKVAIGKYNKEIADDLKCKLCTVKKHLQNAFPKLKVNNRTEATVKFLKWSSMSDQPNEN